MADELEPAEREFLEQLYDACVDLTSIEAVATDLGLTAPYMSTEQRMDSYLAEADKLIAKGELPRSSWGRYDMARDLARERLKQMEGAK